MIPFLLAAAGGYLIAQSRKQDTFADGGEIYSIAEKMSDDEYNEKYSKLNEKQKSKVQSLIRLGDTPKVALATTLSGFGDLDESSDTWKLYSMADGGVNEELPLYYSISYLQKSPKGNDIENWRNWDDEDWLMYGIRHLVYNDIADVEKIGEDEYQVTLLEDDDDEPSVYSGDLLMQLAYDNGLPDSKELEEEESDEMAKGGMTKAKPSAKRIANKLMKIESDIWDKLNIQSGSQLYGDDELQKKYAKELEKSGADKMINQVEAQKVMDILEDNNYHSLYTYFIYRGVLGNGKRDVYVDMYNDGGSYMLLNPNLIQPK